MYMEDYSVIYSGYKFIISNLDSIILTFLIIVVGFIYAVVNNISFARTNLNNQVNKKVIIYETMMNKTDVQGVHINNVSEIHLTSNIEKSDNVVKNECEKYIGNSEKIEKFCNGLHPNVCKYKECCILGSNNNSGNMKCIAGNNSGPTYHQDNNGDTINLDYYYYNGKCYGKKCPL